MKIGRVGPVDRDIASGPREPDRGPFRKHNGADSGTEWPFLWNHDSKKQQSMAVAPDSHGIVKTGKEDEAEKIWRRASHLHINRDFRFNSSPTCGVYTEQKSAGGRAWPNFRMQTPEMEKATCVWLNGTLGLISYWLNSNRSQTGRGGTTVTAIPNIPVLDVTKLDADRLQAAVSVYGSLCQKPMLPANEAWRDPVRQELDRRLLTEVLGSGRRCRRAAGNPAQPMVSRAHGDGNQAHRTGRLTLWGLESNYLNWQRFLPRSIPAPAGGTNFKVSP